MTLPMESPDLIYCCYHEPALFTLICFIGYAISSLLLNKYHTCIHPHFRNWWSLELPGDTNVLHSHHTHSNVSYLYDLLLSILPIFIPPNLYLVISHLLWYLVLKEWSEDQQFEFDVMDMGLDKKVVPSRFHGSESFKQDSQVISSLRGTTETGSRLLSCYFLPETFPDSFHWEFLPGVLKVG